MTGRFALGLALAVGSMACGGADARDIAGPLLSAACVVDEIAVGESPLVTLGAGTGCRRPRFYEPYGRNILDSVANQIDSGSVSGVEIRLVAGRAYQFTAVADGEAAATPVPGPSLTLYGPSRDTSMTPRALASCKFGSRRTQRSTSSSRHARRDFGPPSTSAGGARTRTTISFAVSSPT